MSCRGFCLFSLFLCIASSVLFASDRSPGLQGYYSEDYFQTGERPKWYHYLNLAYLFDTSRYLTDKHMVSWRKSHATSNGNMHHRRNVVCFFFLILLVADFGVIILAGFIIAWMLGWCLAMFGVK